MRDLYKELKEGNTMLYELEYQQPYEMDYDSGPGIGDHVIEHTKHQTSFNAKDDEDAKLAVKKFLSEGSIVFDHHIDGDGKTYYRKLIRLVRVLDA